VGVRVTTTDEKLKFTIVFCPMCNTNLDVEVPNTDEFTLELECNNCGSKFSLTSTYEIVKRYGMYG
jgi:uncharacterized protein YbaR (Trm112 family)